VATNPRRTWMLTLLVASVWINYIDRGTLSIAGPYLAPELGLSATLMGNLHAAFFWSYSVCMLLGGWLVDRYPVRWIYGAGFAVWTLATLAAGFARGFETIFALRVLLGIGQAVAFPSYSKVLSTQFAEDRRGFVNALVDTGTKAGPALGALVGGFLVAWLGWRGLFIVLGAAGLLWLPAWLRVAPDTAAAVQRPPVPAVVAGMLGSRAGWGTCLGLFFFNYVFYFLLTWFPGYLVMERGFTARQMGVFSAIPFMAMALASLLCGPLSDRLIRRGIPAGAVRRGFLIAGLLTATLFLPFGASPDIRLSIGCVVGTCLGIGIATSNLWALTMTLAGPRAAGTWTGIQNGIGNLGGVVAPIVTGRIYDATHSFAIAFTVAAASLVLAALAYSVLLGPSRPMNWRFEDPSAV